mgnify:FL=1
MTLREITIAANEFTDERYSDNQVVEYANEGIAYINGKFKVALPLIVNGEDFYEGFTSSFWTRNLLVPYSAYGIKMNDGSIEEAMIYYARFEEAIEMLGKSLHEAVNEDFLGANSVQIASIIPRRRW